MRDLLTGDNGGRWRLAAVFVSVLTYLTFRAVGAAPTVEVLPFPGSVPGSQSVGTVQVDPQAGAGAEPGLAGQGGGVSAGGTGGVGDPREVSGSGEEAVSGSGGDDRGGAPGDLVRPGGGGGNGPDEQGDDDGKKDKKPKKDKGEEQHGKGKGHDKGKGKGHEQGKGSGHEKDD